MQLTFTFAKVYYRTYQNYKMPLITKATLADVPALNNLVNYVYRGEASKKGWTTEADLLDGQRIDEATLAEYITDTDTVILKYIDDNGAIKASVYLKKTDRGLYLGMLSVNPELQNSGVGKLMLTKAEGYALENNFDKIWMTVISVRDTLIAYYQRNGYQLTGEAEPFPTDTKFGVPKQPLILWVLEKPLVNS